MRIVNILAMVLIFSFIANSNNSAQAVDIVYLKDGSRFVGTIIENIPDQKVVIRLMEGYSERVFTYDKIERIESISLKDLSYREIGVNIGTPALINLAIGQWNGPVNFRLSGMFYGNWAQGIQLNVGYLLSENPRRRHSLGIIGGIWLWESSEGILVVPRDGVGYVGNVKSHDEWKYIGLAYNLHWGKFFTEIGLTTGQGTYQNPQLSFQIGYMHRFLPWPFK